MLKIMVLELDYAIRSYFLLPAVCTVYDVTILHDLISFYEQLAISKKKKKAENGIFPFYPPEVSIVCNIACCLSLTEQYDIVFSTL